MKNIVSFAMICALLVIAPLRVAAQEGDDDRASTVKFKFRFYATSYLEKRSYIHSGEDRFSPGELSHGFAFGGQFRFANFTAPIRIGYFWQKSHDGPYPKSKPSSARLRGAELVFFGYTSEHLLFYALFRGGIYGSDAWRINPSNNQFSGLMAFGISYRIGIGSKYSGLAAEIGLQGGFAGSEAVVLTGGITIKRYH